MASVIGVLSLNGRNYHLEGEKFTVPKMKQLYEPYLYKCYRCNGKGYIEHRNWIGHTGPNIDSLGYETVHAPCPEPKCKDGTVHSKHRTGEIQIGTEERQRSLCGTAILRPNRKHITNNLNSGVVNTKREFDIDNSGYWLCDACKSVWRVINNA